MPRSRVVGYLLVFLIGLIIVGTYKPANAQGASSPAHHSPGFVDENGDGYNDLAPDNDGDGIPNRLDPDHAGAKMHGACGFRGFVDVNGDGINDWIHDFDADGVPNGRDPDWTRTMSCFCPKTGYADGRGGKGMFRARKMDLNRGFGHGGCRGLRIGFRTPRQLRNGSQVAPRSTR